MLHAGTPVPPIEFAAAFGVVATAYFWWSNIKGVHESSTKALRIMQITTVMVVMFLVWCASDPVEAGTGTDSAAAAPSNLEFPIRLTDLGWLAGTRWIQIPLVAIIIAFGHSLLAMSGFETLAQVYREIESPKLQEPQDHRKYRVCVYAVICTGVITLLAGMIIPDAIRPEYVRQPSRRPDECIWSVLNCCGLLSISSSSSSAC